MVRLEKTKAEAIASYLETMTTERVASATPLMPLEPYEVKNAEIIKFIAPMIRKAEMTKRDFATVLGILNVMIEELEQEFFEYNTLHSNKDFHSFCLFISFLKEAEKDSR